MSEIAGYLLQDIDKNTVPWAWNFDDTEKEPTVLPAAFPNLLVNGATGISAGYATDIPPHNLSEVIDAVVYMIDHPLSLIHISFSGTELIGIAAGETDNPKEAVPRAIKTTIGRLVIFFVLTIVVLASLLPMKEADVYKRQK